MTLAIDITDGVAIVTKHIINSCQRRVKEEQGNAVLAVHFTVTVVNQLYISNIVEHFSYKSGVCHAGSKANKRRLAYLLT